MFESPFYIYHQLTKHTVEKLMNNRHFLDWANQPNPFRYYEGAVEIGLPTAFPKIETSYFQVREKNDSGKTHLADIQFVSSLLFYSMAISAWKQIAGTDHKWALRVNPSSGNLHPTDTHLLLTGIDGIADGAYHYYVPKHVLEKRSDGNVGKVFWQALTCSTQTPPVIICLTSIFWRESWKYQQRAFRYCQHDLGHALAAIMLSARALGWETWTIGEFADDEAAKFLGLSGSDEKPFLILGLTPEAKEHFPGKRDPEIKLWQSEYNYRGQANVLSPDIIRYEPIDEVYASTKLTLDSWLNRLKRPLPVAGQKPSFVKIVKDVINTPANFNDVESGDVYSVVRKRRSAVDLDGLTTMPLEHLLKILVSATDGFVSDFQRPWSEADGFNLIHLYVYAHRIDGLNPGVYYFDRVNRQLVLQGQGDVRQAARFVSCFQDIAADGCFAISMIADFNEGYRQFGDRCYRYVHYEAGLIGQWIYLAATALNYEATGIGCFIDDEVNELLKLEEGFEVIYNFTVGRAVLDPRLTTLPAYDFLA